MREAVAAVAGGNLTKAKALRDQVRDPAGAQARRLVRLPRRLRHGGGDSRLPGRQPGLARPRAADPARRGGAVRQRRRPGRGQGLLRRRAAAHRGRLRRAGQRASAADKDEATAKALAHKVWVESRHPGAPRGGNPQAHRRPAHRGRPQAPPRPSAPQRQPLGQRAQRARGRHPARHRPASGAEKKKAEARLAVFLRAKNSQQLSPSCPEALAKRMGPRRAEGPGAAPPEEGRGGLEDPAGRARADARRQARRLVGGAARQRLRGAQGRQAQDRLRAGAQPRRALRQRPQRCGLPRRLAGAAPSPRRQAGARPLPGAGQVGRRPPEPGARPLLAGPHLRGARRPGQGATRATSRPPPADRHLPRPAGAPEARSQRQRAQDRPAGRADAGGESPASTASMRCRPP